MYVYIKQHENNNKNQSKNQEREGERLIVAVLLSVIFFVGYTAIFPPAEQNVSNETAVKQEAVQSLSLIHI